MSIPARSDPRGHRREPVLARLAAILALGAAACGAASTNPGPAGPPAEPAAAIPAFRTIADVRPVLGFALAVHHVGDEALYLRSIDRIAELGANTLVIVTPRFQARVDSTEIRHVPAKCPTDDQLRRMFRRANERGLFTVLIPIVLIEEPGADGWRGVIEPTDWDAWWRSYRAMIDWAARLATDAEIDLLAVGSELNSTQPQVDRWTTLIEHVRGVYPGQLTYAANWDRYERVPFWDRLDAISLSAYFELARDEPRAPVERIASAWMPIRSQLLAYAERIGRPLLMTEIGYPSLPTANTRPWNYVAEEDQRADHRQQARCWEAFFEQWTAAVADTDGPMAGFCCYHWDPYHRGDRFDTGYGVEGKPARRVIERGFRVIREAAEADRGRAGE